MLASMILPASTMLCYSPAHFESSWHQCVCQLGNMRSGPAMHGRPALLGFHGLLTKLSADSRPIIAPAPPPPSPRGGWQWVVAGGTTDTKRMDQFFMHLLVGCSVHDTSRAEICQTFSCRKCKDTGPYHLEDLATSKATEQPENGWAKRWRA